MPLQLPSNLSRNPDGVEVRLRLDRGVSEYLDRLAYESGATKRDLIRYLLTHAAGAEARSLSVVESAGGVLYVDSTQNPDENEFALWLSRIRFERRWPWLTYEERAHVAEARELMLPRKGEVAGDGLDRAAEYLRANGFTVTRTKEA